MKPQKKSKVKSQEPRAIALRPLTFDHCLLFVAFVFFVGCQGGGGFHDIAKVKQTTHELRRIRNAIEEYKLDHGYYPCEESDLETKLAPYLSKLVYSEGKEAASYSGIVLGAENNLSQMRSALSGCARIKDERISSIFADVQESLELYQKELRGEPVDASDRLGSQYSILPEIKKIQSLIDSLRPEETKSSQKDSLLLLGTQIAESIDSLIPMVGEEEHLKNISNTFKWYNAKLLKKELKEEVRPQGAELYSPEGEIEALKETIKDMDIILNLQKMVSSYRTVESFIDYYDFLLATRRDLDRISKLVSLFEGKRNTVKEAAIIVQAQTTLHRMADALRDYRKEKGKFPSQDTGIDSLLHLYFIETKMGGEQIDRWSSALGWFSDGYIYKTKDPTTGFVLSAKVNNKTHTRIRCAVSVQNQWDKITSVFACPPIYTTPDSTHTYFIRVRAKDTGRTWVTDRPTITKKGA